MHTYIQVFECMYDATKLLSGQRYQTQYLPTLTGFIEFGTQYNKDAVDYDFRLGGDVVEDNWARLLDENVEPIC